MEKTLSLIGQTVALSEVRGIVEEMQISKETVVSGGGGGGFVYKGSGGMGSLSISSRTISSTKFYLQIDGREQVFEVPGEFEARKGHEVTIAFARYQGRESYAYFLNHSIGRKSCRSGDVLADQLGILQIGDPSIGRMLGVITALSVMAGLLWKMEAAIAVFFMLLFAVGLLGFPIYRLMSRKKRLRQADREFKAFTAPF